MEFVSRFVLRSARRCGFSRAVFGPAIPGATVGGLPGCRDIFLEARRAELRVAYRHRPILPTPEFCWGAYSGNPYCGARQTLASDRLGRASGGASLGGQASDHENVEVITRFSGEPSGTVDFNTALSGRHVLALKGSTTFSLFCFDLLGPVNSIGFVMDDPATSPQGGAQDLSNTSIWWLETASVPEPGLVLMLLTGIPLLAVGVRRRGTTSARSSGSQMGREKGSGQPVGAFVVRAFGNIERALWERKVALVAREVHRSHAPLRASRYASRRRPLSPYVQSRFERPPSMTTTR